MATAKRGATRRVVKPKKTIAWHNVGRQMILLLTFVVIVAAVIYSRQSNILPITHVSVEGEFQHIDKATLVAAVKPHTMGSFLSINVDRISDAAEALPWVRQVQVRRVWPDGLHLMVEEQVPVAQWQESRFINSTGDIFPASKGEVKQTLPVLMGPEGSEKVMMQRFLSMTRALTPMSLSIKQLIMDKRRAWRLVLNNDIKVALGRADSEQRFARFLSVYQHKFQAYHPHIAVMDMRYPNGLSVVWKTGQKPDLNGTV